MKSFTIFFSMMLTLGLLQGCIGAKSAPTPIAEPATSAPEPQAVVAAIGDADGDGITDDLDECPDTPAGAKVDAKGCEIIIRLSGPLFDFDKSTLTDKAQSVLTDAASLLADHPSKKIEVAGHTDSIGTEEYNLKLGTRRAEAVKQFLVSKGISPDRLRTTSYGELQPVASNSSREGRSLNRRVELIDKSN